MPSCPHCKGTGADPEDQGDYDPNVHMYNPTTIGPCPECHGEGQQLTCACGHPASDHHWAAPDGDRCIGNRNLCWCQLMRPVRTAENGDQSDEGMPEFHSVDNVLYLCHEDDHYCPKGAR